MINLLIKWLGGGILDKVIDAFTKSEDIRLQNAKIDADVAKEAMKAYVSAQQDQNRLQEAKFAFPWFWLMIAMFIIPLGAWWTAVIADSIFHFGWKVANLPTQELREWASQMIAFLFYTGGTVAGIKMLTRR